MVRSLIKYLTQPRGPSFKNTRGYTLNFSGSKVHFRAPVYNYPMLDEKDNDSYPDSYNLYDNSQYSPAVRHEDDHDIYKPAADVPSVTCFKTVWSIKEPLVGGGKYDAGTVSFIVVLYKVPRCCSLFNPKNMERAIIETIDVYRGPFSSLGRYGRRYKAPLRWRLLNSNGLHWVGYFIEENSKEGGGEAVWAIPLSNEHYIHFRYTDTYIAPTSRLQEVTTELIEQIIRSVRIDYNPTAQVQIAEAKAQDPDARFSEHREPQVWAIYDEQPELFYTPAKKREIERRAEVQREVEELGIEEISRRSMIEHNVKLDD